MIRPLGKLHLAKIWSEYSKVLYIATRLGTRGVRGLFAAHERTIRTMVATTNSSAEICLRSAAASCRLLRGAASSPVEAPPSDLCAHRGQLNAGLQGPRASVLTFRTWYNACHIRARQRNGPRGAAPAPPRGRVRGEVRRTSRERPRLGRALIVWT